MNLVRLTVLAALVPMAALAAPPLEVKGVAIGATVAEIKAVFPEAHCDANSCMSAFDLGAIVKGCKYSGPTSPCFTAANEVWRYGSAHVDSYDFRLRDSRVAIITVTLSSSVMVRPVVTALTEKYGTPTRSSTISIPTASGAAEDALMVAWVRPDGQINASQLPSINKGSVMFSAASNAAADAKEREASAKENAAKL